MDVERDTQSGSVAPISGASTQVESERGPGVHVVADTQPARAGRLLAAELGAELADTAMTAARALRARTVRPQPTPADGTASQADVELERRVAERFAAHDEAASMWTLAAAHVARLRLLAAAVERAQRLCERTESATSTRMVATSGLPAAVPPDVLRQALAALLKAQHAVDALGATDEALDPARNTELVLADTAAGQTGADDGYPPVLNPITIGVLLVSVALAGAILLSGLPAVVALAPILLGLFAAGLARQIDASPFEWRNSDGTLLTRAGPGSGLFINAPTAAAVAARSASAVSVIDAPPRPGGQGDEGRTEAHERLEEAQRRWVSLAGTADPSDIAALVSRADRQRGDVTMLVADTTEVRAAIEFLRRARVAWADAWRAFDDDDDDEPVPEATSGPGLEAALARLTERIEGVADPEAEENTDGAEPIAGPIAKPVAGRISRQRLNDLLAERTLDAVIPAEPGPVPTPTTPLVLVEPFAGLDDDRQAEMKRRLEGVAAHHEVIVIVRYVAESATSPAS